MSIAIEDIVNTVHEASAVQDMDIVCQLDPLGLLIVARKIVVSKSPHDSDRVLEQRYIIPWRQFSFLIAKTAIMSVAQTIRITAEAG